MLKFTSPLATAICLLASTSLFGQLPNTQFYEAGAHQLAGAVIVASDSSIVAVGGRYDSLGMKHWHDADIIKIDPDGSVDWSRFIGSTGDDFFHDVVEVPTGGFMAVGQQMGFHSGAATAVKFDMTGQVAVNKAYSDTGMNFIARAVANTSDGGFLIVGSAIPDGDDADVLLMKLDFGGDLVWLNTVDANGLQMDDHAYDLVHDAGSVFRVTGTSHDITNPSNTSPFHLTIDHSTGIYGLSYTMISGKAEHSLLAMTKGFSAGFAHDTLGSESILVSAISASLQPMYSIYLDAPGDERAQAILETTSGDVLIAGYHRGMGQQDNDAFVALLDRTTLIPKWAKLFADTFGQGAYGLAELPGGHEFVVFGIHAEEDSTESDVFLLQIDTAGASSSCFLKPFPLNPVTPTFSANFVNPAVIPNPHPDNGLAGFNSHGSPTQKECLATSSSYSLQETGIQVYPNPTAGSFSLVGSELLAAVEIIDWSGKTIRRYTPQSEYNTDGMPAGLYLVRVASLSGESQVIRLMLQ